MCTKIKHFLSGSKRLIRHHTIFIALAAFVSGGVAPALLAQEPPEKPTQSDTTKAVAPVIEEKPMAEQDAASIPQTYTAGVEHLKSGNAQGAVTSFEDILRRDPTHTESMINLARAYLDLQQFDKAESTIDGAIASDSANAEAYLVRGRVMQSKGNAEAAISAYHNSIDLDQQNPFAYNNLALIYIQDGRYSEAIPLLEKAVEQKSDIPFFHNNLGIAYEGMGNFSEAEVSFQQTLNIDPGYEKAVANLQRVQNALAEQGITNGSTEVVEDSTMATKK